MPENWLANAILILAYLAWLICVIRVLVREGREQRILWRQFEEKTRNAPDGPYDVKNGRRKNYDPRHYIPVEELLVQPGVLLWGAYYHESLDSHSETEIGAGPDEKVAASPDIQIDWVIATNSRPRIAQ